MYTKPKISVSTKPAPAVAATSVRQKAAFNSPKAKSKPEANQRPGAGLAPQGGNMNGQGQQGGNIQQGGMQQGMSMPQRKTPPLALPPSPSNSGQQMQQYSSSSSQQNIAPPSKPQRSSSGDGAGNATLYADASSPIASARQKAGPQAGQMPNRMGNNGGQQNNGGMYGNGQMQSNGNSNSNDQGRSTRLNVNPAMNQQNRGNNQKGMFSPQFDVNGESKQANGSVVPSPGGQNGKLHNYSPPCLRSVRRALLNHRIRSGGQYDPAEMEELEDDSGGVEDEEEFDPFIFIKHLPPLSAAARNRKSPIPMKAKDAPHITLALDLDETLVHCSVQPIDNAELTFNVNFNGLDYEVYVRTRPHLEHFLRTVSQWFEIIIFTASQKVYADKLLNILDPKNEYIQHRVFRDSCVNVDGNYLKDLHILGREIPKVAIVDNSMQAFGFQVDNGIPIESWFDDDNDSELLSLIPFLRQLKDAKDVRPLIRQTFKLQEFIEQL